MVVSKYETIDGKDYVDAKTYDEVLHQLKRANDKNADLEKRIKDFEETTGIFVPDVIIDSCEVENGVVKVNLKEQEKMVKFSVDATGTKTITVDDKVYVSIENYKEKQTEVEKLAEENKELHRELQEIAITDNLPYEPIAVAEFLINKTGKYEHNSFMKAFTGNKQGTYNIYGISKLRQIAEHLLVYCNNNKDEG